VEGRGGLSTGQSSEHDDAGGAIYDIAGSSVGRLGSVIARMRSDETGSQGSIQVFPDLEIRQPRRSHG
jgi:hypothetical protein